MEGNSGLSPKLGKTFKYIPPQLITFLKVFTYTKFPTISQIATILSKNSNNIGFIIIIEL